MNKYIKHFLTVTKHRNIVMILCFKCGQYKRGLTHDLSKYGRTEFCQSARYFQGDHSPIEEEIAEKGYSIVCQHHKGHNPHHWEYWIDNIETRQNTPISIPFEYVVEMICDWVSAGIVYSGEKCDFDLPYGEPEKYYFQHCNERIIHPETERLIRRFLAVISKHGVNEFCRMAKKMRKDGEQDARL